MLASHKGEIPFVVFIIPFLARITLALSFNFSAYQTAIGMLFGMVVTAFIALNMLYSRLGVYRHSWLGGVIMHGVLFLTGIVATLNFDNRSHSNYFEKHPAKYLLVKVSNEPQFKANFLRFTAEVELVADSVKKQATSGTLLLVMPADSAHAAKIIYGDELLIPAKYNAVDAPFNPAEFNYKQYLAHQNIYAQSFLNPHDVVELHTNTGNPLVAYSLQLRKRLVGQFKQYLHNPSAIAVASTLILGYKADLDNDILQAYSKTGTIHVLSVSGAHVAIIFAMINLLLGFLDRYKYGRLLKAVISITLIWYYSLLTGLSPAVCRAAVMISMIIIGKTYNRRINTLNILAVSAFVILLFDPFLITDVGFQLSYLAVAGLIVFQPLVYNWLDIKNKWLDKLWLLCSVSIAAQVITFPLSAYYFHQFPVYFLVSNLFIIVPSFIIMCAGVAFLLLAQTGWLIIIKPVAFVLEASIILMNQGLQYVEHAPYASIGKIWLSQGEYLLLFAVAVLAFCVLYYRKASLIIVTLLCVLVLSVSFSAKRVAGMQSQSITFFNLKKHSSILFKQGDRGVLLSDLTDTDKAYKYTIQPFLDSNRIAQLTLLPFKKDTANSFFIKKGNLVRFIDRDVLIYNKAALHQYITPKLYADYLFITDNPHTNIKSVDACYSYKNIILDAANTDKVIATFKEGLENADKKLYTLKRNKALIIQSN
jgi:competence protein ComEC